MTSRWSILLLGCAAVALAQPAKVARDLPQTGAPLRVIVQYRSAPSQSNLNQVAAAGGRVEQSLAQMRAAVAVVPPARLSQLAASPDVLYISPDRPVRPAMDHTVPTAGANVAQQYGYDGAGIAVAVIDSGIAEHADFLDPLTGRSRVVYRESFVSPHPADRYGHGTHVAGTVAGNGGLSGGTLRGIAPRARLVDLQALDEQGVGSDSSVIAALERAVELKDVYGIRVVNLSIGRPLVESYRVDPICQAVEAAWNAGLVVVVSAGNYGRDGFPGADGYWTVASPGNDPYAITVGAMRSMDTAARGDDLIASYSSKGPTLIDQVVKPDLVAPGNRVKAPLASLACTLRMECPEATVDLGKGAAQYLTLSGTSMAAGVVSGAAALVLQQNPRLTPDQVKARLMATASKTFPSSSVVYDSATGRTYRSQYDIFTIGAGYLDIMAALTTGTAVSGSAQSPVAMFNSGTGQVVITPGPGTAWTSVGGLSAAWGNSVFVGGASAAWGNSVAWGSSAAWGNSVAWGDSAARGNSAAWGSSVAWGDSTTPLGEK